MPALGADGSRLERFVFRVVAGESGIEVEAELLSGQIAEPEWRALTGMTWVREGIRAG